VSLVIPKRLLFLVGATLVAALVRAQSPELVEVGGHRIDTLRSGAGSPAVVFETGLADTLDTWAPLVPAVGEYSTAVAYSRAGFGRSDGGKGDHSARAEVVELRALLAQLGLRPPFVLVGRSYGGLLVRLFTSLYPGEVAGLVLVDGTHERQVERFGALDAAYPAQFRASFEARLASLPPGAEAAEIRETMRIQAAGTVDGLQPLPDLPIAVLTSMRSDASSPYVNASVRGHEVWRSLHEEWFRRSTNGVHIVTTRSGHDIQREEPQLVMGAIRFVLDRVRAR
jgi:pimeloyl-ACP methyl ester carboxylesterase